MKFLSQPMNVVIVAGASGIGKAIARRFADEECKLFIADINKSFIVQCQTEFPDWYCRSIDVASSTQVEDFFVGIGEKTSHIDVLINCAGVAGPTAPLENITPEDWRAAVDVNLNGMFYTLKYAIPLLRKSASASIINLGSTASLFGFPSRSPYAATKWATIGLTKTLAMELGGDMIRVNAICPGSVKGERIDNVMQAAAVDQGKSLAEINELYMKHVSMKIFVEPSDVSNLALFLASDYGRYISGQAIGLDGHTEGLSNNI